VGDCKRGGHKKITHPKLANFFGSSFDGGHDADSQLKPYNVTKMIRLFETYQVELDQMEKTP